MDCIWYIFSTMGIFVLNYIDKIISIAPHDVYTVSFFWSILNNSKIDSPILMPTRLDISFDIQIRVFKIYQIARISFSLHFVRRY
jgi:hypothetical protein